MEYTGERMIPAVNKGWLTYSDHVARYASLLGLAKDKKVLDIACGAGYGTQMLAQVAKNATGIDVSRESVNYAKKHFDAPGVVFMEGSAYDIPLKDDSMELAVSFETLEHLEDHQKFYQEIKRILAQDGVFAVSVPNVENPLHGTNHFHVSELSLKEFKQELTEHFPHTAFYYQNIWITSQLLPEKVYVSEDSLEKSEAEFIKPFESKPADALVFVALASQSELPKLNPMFAPSQENVLELLQTLEDYRQLDKTLNDRIANMESYIKELEVIRDKQGQ